MNHFLIVLRLLSALCRYYIANRWMASPAVSFSRKSALADSGYSSLTKPRKGKGRSAARSGGTYKGPGGSARLRCIHDEEPVTARWQHGLHDTLKICITNASKRMHAYGVTSAAFDGQPVTNDALIDFAIWVK